MLAQYSLYMSVYIFESVNLDKAGKVGLIFPAFFDLFAQMHNLWLLLIQRYVVNGFRKYPFVIRSILL